MNSSGQILSYLQDKREESVQRFVGQASQQKDGVMERHDLSKALSQNRNRMEALQAVDLETIFN
jgi:ERCC4-related helicase